MKTISLAAIGLGSIGLIVAIVEKFVHKNLLEVSPANYVHVAAALFLLAVALMCHGRFYGSDSAQKKE